MPEHKRLVANQLRRGLAHIQGWLYHSQAILCRAWLRTNDRTLRKYSVDELVRMANTCGFPIDVATIEVRQRKLMIQRWQEFWESPLSAKWLRVVDYERGVDHE